MQDPVHARRVVAHHGGMSRRSFVPWLIAALLAVVAGRTALGTDGAGSGHGPFAASVVRVVDGDTIIARLAGGRIERVRLIGMDTPESVKPGVPVQCYALRASAATKHLLTGRRVRLVEDREARDRYGRLLAYVYRQPDGLFVNAELVRRGLARPYPYAPNTRFAGRIAGLAEAARAAGKGLWSAC
jgi:micrococcal nuclease